MKTSPVSGKKTIINLTPLTFTPEVQDKVWIRRCKTFDTLLECIKSFNVFTPTESCLTAMTQCPPDNYKDDNRTKAASA